MARTKQSARKNSRKATDTSQPPDKDEKQVRKHVDLSSKTDEEVEALALVDVISVLEHNHSKDGQQNLLNPTSDQIINQLPRGPWSTTYKPRLGSFTEWLRKLTIKDPYCPIVLQLRRGPPDVSLQQSTCNICKIVYSGDHAPKLLHCFHRFCCSCLSAAITSTDRDTSVIKCPTCEYETTIDVNTGASSLMTDFSVLHWLKNFEEGAALEHQPSKKIKTDMTVPIEEVRGMSHQEEIFSDEVLDRKSPQTEIMCSLHPTAPASHACCTCSVTVCSECTDSHTGHTTLGVDEAFHQSRDTIERTIDALHRSRTTMGTDRINLMAEEGRLSRRAELLLLSVADHTEKVRVCMRYPLNYSLYFTLCVCNKFEFTF